ncbi:monoacylglycerol lipase ABHD6-like [Xenia sp. Carnegie-2017]|uniref:monoacylglycerol lipase ABHD6-like n=1 Tax=Xenia sp. Carnegie-2017 TaxID=2897299 RepID=UPI001F046985|nr:monoacylglycerol lipase ABHD6-like [Xenia sp. Carnegie-2017]
MFVIQLLFDILFFIFIAFVLTALAFACVYFLRPVWLIYLINWCRMKRAGLVKRSLKVTDALKISYLERKSSTNSPLLIFVHGFTSDKEFFCEVSSLLPSMFHMVLIDLPGHGESTPRDKTAMYSPSAFVDYLHEFIKAFGVGDRRFHLIGSSLGGCIVGSYAAKYGDENLSSVVATCPSGIRSPIFTEFLQKSHENVINGVFDNVLIPTIVEDFQKIMRLVAYRKVNIPKQIARGYVEIKQRNADMYKKALRDMNSEEEYLLLDGLLEDIKCPMLCLWGENDEVLHVSGSDVIKERVKDVEVHILKECGHALTLDKPREMAKLISQFLERVLSS